MATRSSLTRLSAQVAALGALLGVSRRRVICVSGYTEEDFARALAPHKPAPDDFVICVRRYTEPGRDYSANLADVMKAVDGKTRGLPSEIAAKPAERR